MEFRKGQEFGMFLDSEGNILYTCEMSPLPTFVKIHVPFFGFSAWEDFNEFLEMQIRFREEHHPQIPEAIEKAFENNHF